MGLFGSTRRITQASTSRNETDNSNTVAEDGGIVVRGSGNVIAMTDFGAVNVASDIAAGGAALAGSALDTVRTINLDSNLLVQSVTGDAIGAVERATQESLFALQNSNLGSQDFAHSVTADALSTAERISREHTIATEALSSQAIGAVERATQESLFALQNSNLGNQDFARDIAGNALSTVERISVDNNIFAENVTGLALAHTGTALQQIQIAQDNALRHGEVISTQAFDVARESILSADLRMTDLLDFAKEFTTESVLSAAAQVSQGSEVTREIASRAFAIADKSQGLADARAADAVLLAGDALNAALEFGGQSRQDVVLATNSALQAVETATRRALDFIKNVTQPDQQTTELSIKAFALIAVVIGALGLIAVGMRK